MKDRRLASATAALDDARSLLVDVVDDRPGDATPADYEQVDEARQYINSAITCVQAADTSDRDDEFGGAR